MTSVRSRADLDSIHRFCSQNRALQLISDRAGCFYCLELFASTDVVDWIDGRLIETGSLSDGVTAICPRCGIDAVLFSAAPIDLDTALLRAMRSYWFDQ